jgi:hypothetical protein
LILRQAQKQPGLGQNPVVMLKSIYIKKIWHYGLMPLTLPLKVLFKRQSLKVKSQKGIAV